MDKNDNKTKNSLLHTMYHARVDGALEESLRKDQHYQRVNKEANPKIRKVERLKLNQAIAFTREISTLSPTMTLSSAVMLTTFPITPMPRHYK